MSLNRAMCAFMLCLALVLPLSAQEGFTKYDDAEWHYGGKFPVDSPIEYGGVHIGLFLKWSFLQGWAGDLHLKLNPDAVAQVIAGSMTGTAFLFKYCDGALTSEDLNAEGNAFARQYYGEDGAYLVDYASHFSKLMYRSGEEAHDFAAFSAMIENRREIGVLTSGALNAVRTDTPPPTGYRIEVLAPEGEQEP